MLNRKTLAEVFKFCRTKLLSHHFSTVWPKLQLILPLKLPSQKFWQTHLPGQLHSAHDLICLDFPAQEIGAKTALWLMAWHVLFRWRVPAPHVLVQSVHELHRDHLDSAMSTTITIKATVITKIIKVRIGCSIIVLFFHIINLLLIRLLSSRRLDIGLVLFLRV